jgi:TPR repeat protein
MTSEQHRLYWQASDMVESIGHDAPPPLLSLRQELLATPLYSLSKSVMTDFWNCFEASTPLRINLGKGGWGAQGLGWGAQGLGQAAAQGSSHAAERRMPRQDSPQSSSHPQGSTYETGISVEADKAKAAQLWEQAAEQGIADAQFNLGSCYAAGDGVEVDMTKAAQLWEQAAEQGLAQAQYMLGKCYAAGEGVEMDKAKAAQLWGQAAERGLACAQVSVGACYNLGQGVAVDKAKAVQLFRQAAEQGEAMARWALGLCYEHGIGVPHDMLEAVALYRLAIEDGNVNATLSLACVMRREGASCNRRLRPSGCTSWRPRAISSPWISSARVRRSCSRALFRPACRLIQCGRASGSSCATSTSPRGRGALPTTSSSRTSPAGATLYLSAALAAARFASSRRAPNAASRASATGSVLCACGPRTMQAATRGAQSPRTTPSSEQS